LSSLGAQELFPKEKNQEGMILNEIAATMQLGTINNKLHRLGPKRGRKRRKKKKKRR
jgi:hypothetical protein